MRTKPFLLTLLFVLIIAPSSVSAIGATNCGARYIPYEPYLEVSFGHQVLAANYRVSLEGVWNESMTITSETETSVSGTLTMPPDWDQPGTIENFVVFEEVPPDSRTGTAIATTRVRCPIYVRVPYPGEYLEFGFGVSDINEGEVAQASYRVASRGDDPVSDARVAIAVEKNGTTYATYSERLRRIQPRAEIKETVELTTDSLQPGVYLVTGTLTYADEEVVVEREMRVGTLDVAIVNYTRTLPIEDFTRINFSVENRWNNPVDDVVISYRIANDQQTFNTVTTETFGLKPFEVRTIRSIAETPSPIEGVAFIEYTISFDGSERRGVLPVAFAREATDYRLVLFVLLGILLTIMVVISVILVRKNGHEKRKGDKKRASSKRS